MNVMEAVRRTFDHYSRKLPRWVSALIVLWLLFAALVYFGAVTLPEIGWWRLVVLAPMAILVLAVVLQMIAFVISWITAPARWLIRKKRS